MCAVCVIAVFVFVPVSGYVMSDVFVNWSNMLTGFMTWAIAC